MVVYGSGSFGTGVVQTRDYCNNQCYEVANVCGESSSGAKIITIISANRQLEDRTSEQDKDKMRYTGVKSITHAVRHSDSRLMNPC